MLNTATISRPVHRLHRKRTLLAVLNDLLALYRSRRALETLSSAQLDDIGVTRNEARTEAARPVWDVPAHWLS